ncbi:ATP-binding protein [Candidatus Methanarcanum hacksteinii]|uniref:ATP-binding protein n=1 Tax=Candidatus Methanarcanum hacksteinii TaxID=2911857 RepID=UPI0037DDA029
MTNENRKISLFDANALNSMEFTGYDLTMAVAELVDNSLDEDATEIKMVLSITKATVNVRDRDRVFKFALIDNGNGMDPTVLQKSLTVGGSTHNIYSTGKKKTIGKFGMGLPQASLNMAKIVHVWSWQNGVDSALHVYIDRTAQDAEPGIDYPDDEPFPHEYYQFCKDYKSGTIVCWSELINTGFSRKPVTIFEDIQYKIGRIYRYFLHNDNCKMSMVSIDASGKISEEEHYFKPVDPLFLMEDGYCGGQKEKPPVTPMFEQYGDTVCFREKIDPDDDQTYPITIKFSKAKKEIWPGDKNDSTAPGSHEYGKVAKKNIGVSIIRSDRELEFIDDWHCPDSSDSRNRWWGVEIDFDTAFDTIFGVDNRKQSARLFHEYAVKPKTKIENEFGLDEEHLSQDIENLKGVKHNVYILLKVIFKVDRIIDMMTKEINEARAKEPGKKGGQKRYGDTPSDNPEKYDGTAEERGKDPRTQSATDKELEKDPERTGVETELGKDPKYTDEQKDAIRDDVKAGHRCTVLRAPLDSAALFGVDRKSSQMILMLNTNHPMYQKIFGIYDDLIAGKQDLPDPKVLLEQAYDSIELMLSGWVRMEDESRSDKEKENYRSTRETWGRIIRELEDYDADN